MKLESRSIRGSLSVPTCTYCPPQTRGGTAVFHPVGHYMTVPIERTKLLIQMGTHYCTRQAPGVIVRLHTCPSALQSCQQSTAKPGAGPEGSAVVSLNKTRCRAYGTFCYGISWNVILQTTIYLEGARSSHHMSAHVQSVIN